jgi:DNA-directed RNA polymerase subunit M/transcription elongation factor TFIIS
MNIEMYDDMNSDSDALVCPRCGYNYMHHENIIVYNRSEDEKETTVTTIEGMDVVTKKVPSAEANNPSTRRHGLTITFTCEGCEEKYKDEFELHLAQHKGNTYIGWGEFKHESEIESEDDCELY